MFPVVVFLPILLYRPSLKTWETLKRAPAAWTGSLTSCDQEAMMDRLFAARHSISSADLTFTSAGRNEGITPLAMCQTCDMWYSYCTYQKVKIKKVKSAVSVHQELRRWDKNCKPCWHLWSKSCDWSIPLTSICSSGDVTGLIQLKGGTLSLWRCELIPVFTLLSHCLKHRHTHTFIGLCKACLLWLSQCLWSFSLLYVFYLFMLLHSSNHHGVFR